LSIQQINGEKNTQSVQLTITPNIANNKVTQRRLNHSLLHVADDTVCLSSTLVLTGNTLSKDLQSRVTTNVLAGTDIGFSGTIDLAQFDFFVKKGGGGDFVFGSKGFAVTAPGC
jgi:hypothetical protein